MSVFCWILLRVWKLKIDSTIYLYFCNTSSNPKTILCHAIFVTNCWILNLLMEQTKLLKNRCSLVLSLSSSNFHREILPAQKPFDIYLSILNLNNILVPIERCLCPNFSMQDESASNENNIWRKDNPTKFRTAILILRHMMMAKN